MAGKSKPVFSAPGGEIYQIKVRLLGISPMIWRRVLVPASFTLRELHGLIQAAMGWQGLHLFVFEKRAASWGTGEPGGDYPEITLEELRLRKNEKLLYVYDMGDWWAHELRIEDRIEAVRGKVYPRCVGGAGACPPEDCGGPERYLEMREEAVGSDAMEDLLTMADMLQEIVVEGRSDILDDEDRRWDLEVAAERSQARAPFLKTSFSRRDVNARLKEGAHRSLMHQHY